MIDLGVCLAISIGFILTLIIAGVLRSRRCRPDRLADLKIVGRAAPGDQLIIVFPGFAMPGERIGDLFTPYLGRTDTLVVVKYGEREVDIADIGSRLVAVIKKIQPSKLRLYGASMGGMCAADFLRHFDVATTQDTETILFLDTSPSAANDVRIPQALSRLGTRYHGGPLGSLLWRLIAQAYPFAPSEPDVDRSTLRSAQQDFAKAGSRALLSQARYIKRFTAVPASNWSSSVDRAIFLRGIPSGGDPIIAIDSAVNGWKKILPGLYVSWFTERLDKWHAPIIERPKETMEMIMDG